MPSAFVLQWTLEAAAETGVHAARHDSVVVHPFEAGLSFEISLVLLVTYALSLVFSLRTHKQLFAGHTHEAAQVEGGDHKSWSMSKSVGVLAGATALIAWMSEILVGSVEQAAHAFGMTSLFVGVIVSTTSRRRHAW